MESQAATRCIPPKKCYTFGTKVAVVRLFWLDFSVFWLKVAYKRKILWLRSPDP